MQDLPPLKGYQPLQWKRNLPSRGFRPSVWLAGLIGMTAYGFYQIALGNRERTELRREKLWSRINLMPMLISEQDRNILRRSLASYEREAEIMKDVDWWEVKDTYSNKDIWRPPQTVVMGQQLDGDSGITQGNSRSRW